MLGGVGARAWILMLGWLVGWWLLWRVPWLRADANDDALAGGEGSTRRRGDRGRDLALGCSVIIPARNEESSLGLLLESLGHQSIRPEQVIVVDDRSEDRTAAIARAHGVSLVEGAPVPEGWTGKAWACHQGAEVAIGDTFVFLDADVVLDPSGLEAVLAEHADRGGLVSVQPFHRMQRAYERLSALFNIIGFMGIGAASPGRDAAARGAFGPVLVTGREVYELVGGHEAVRGEIVEDLALARRYRRAGEPVHSFGGGRLAGFRMYPDGLGQLIEGWSKNIATGASNVRVGRLALVGFWVTCVLLSVQSLIEAAIGAPAIGWAEAAVGYVLFAGQLALMLRQLGNFGVWPAALYPAPVGIFLLVFVRSTYLTLVRRRVTWRGRSIPLSKQRRWSTASMPGDE